MNNSISLTEVYHNIHSHIWYTIKDLLEYLNKDCIILKSSTALTFCYNWNYVLPKLELAGANIPIQKLIEEWIATNNLNYEFTVVDNSNFILHLAADSIITIHYDDCPYDTRWLTKLNNFLVPKMLILSNEILQGKINPISAVLMDYISQEFSNVLDDDWLYWFCECKYENLDNCLPKIEHPEKDVIVTRYKNRNRPHALL